MIAPPRSLFLQTTTECHLRCRMCHLWTTTEPPTTLTTTEKLALIDELAAWSPDAVVVLTGGETMRKREEFFALSTACRAHGLSSAANTSGTLIDDATVDRLLTDGPKYLVLSLDSRNEQLHDAMRGVRGTWQRVVTSIQGLVSRRRDAFPGSDVRVMVNCILIAENVDDVGEFIEFASILGVDGIMFQPLARTFGIKGERDRFFEQHVPRDVAAFDAAIDAIAEAHRRGRPIATTDNDLRYMRLYVRNPDFVGEQVCGSAERNVMVDVHGNVQLCFNMLSLFGGRTLGNVRDSGLRSPWESQFAAEARVVMAQCRKNCGMLNCHRRSESR